MADEVNLLPAAALAEFPAPGAIGRSLGDKGEKSRQVCPDPGRWHVVVQVLMGRFFKSGTAARPRRGQVLGLWLFSLVQEFCSEPAGAAAAQKCQSPPGRRR